ncbi:MAG: hypothetical protein WBN68_20890 [Sedimenticolaceae bacterium]
MTDKAAYASWEASAREVERIAKDPSLPLWEKARHVGTAYTTVALDGLRSKHRHKIFRHIVKVNDILQKYMPETFEDYQHMDEADLEALIGLFRAMGPGK